MMLCDVCPLVFQGRTERTYFTTPFAYNHHRNALGVQDAADQVAPSASLLRFFCLSMRSSEF